MYLRTPWLDPCIESMLMNIKGYPILFEFNMSFIFRRLDKTIQDGRRYNLRRRGVKGAETAEEEPNHSPAALGTALLHAAADGKRESMLILLSNGADPNFKARDGQTPLLAAVAKWVTFNHSMACVVDRGGKDPRIDADYASVQRESVGSMSNLRRYDWCSLRIWETWTLIGVPFIWHKEWQAHELNMWRNYKNTWTQFQNSVAFAIGRMIQYYLYIAHDAMITYSDINEGLRYNVTSSLIGLAHIQNDPSIIVTSVKPLFPHSFNPVYVKE